MSKVSNNGQVELSIVIPVFNEEAILERLTGRIDTALPEIKAALEKNEHLLSEQWLEVLFVDDGSTDKTPQILQRALQERPCVRCITFSRNFGHQPAVSAGLLHARGRVVVIMDADLQDPPELIVKMIDKWVEGYDAVYAVRRTREAPFLLNLAYKLYYFLARLVADHPVQKDAGDFCLLDRRVVDRINELPEKERYLRGLRAWVGFNQTGVEYDRKSRELGESKYSFASLAKLAFHGLLSTSIKPLFLSGVFCVFGLLAVAALLIYTLYGKFFVPASVMPRGWTSIMLTVLFFSAAQLISIWLLSLYISRIYREILSRPTHVIQSDSLKQS